jgi:hypothetical protein
MKKILAAIALVALPASTAFASRIVPAEPSAFDAVNLSGTISRMTF